MHQRLILRGSHSLTLLEGSAEGTLIGKTGLIADFLNWKLGVAEKIACVGHAGMNQIFMGRIAGFPLEDAKKIVETETSFSSKGFQRDGACKMIVDVGNGLFCNTCMGE